VRTLVANRQRAVGIARVPVPYLRAGKNNDRRSAIAGRTGSAKGESGRGGRGYSDREVLGARHDLGLIEHHRKHFVRVPCSADGELTD